RLLCRHRRRRGGRRRGGGSALRGGGGGHRGLRPGRGGDRQRRSDRYAIQEMLHASILCGSSGLELRCKARTTRGVALADLGAETSCSLFRSREHATFGVTYPTSPAADNMTGGVRFSSV